MKMVDECSSDLRENWPLFLAWGNSPFVVYKQFLQKLWPSNFLTIPGGGFDDLILMSGG